MLTIISSFCMSFLGFAALALSMDRHQEELGRRQLGRFSRWTMRALGVALLALSLLHAVVGMGRSCGVMHWLGLLTPAALTVTALICLQGIGSRER